MEKTDWIIAIANSDSDGATIRRFFGTEDEVKILLVSLVEEDKENDEEGYDYGTESVDDVEADGFGRFDASATYSTYHIDYSAEELSRLYFLDTDGNTYNAKKPSSED